MPDILSCTLVTSTYPSLETAQQTAAALIDGRLAACVQIGAPVTSTYRWHDQLETAQEYPLCAKTASDRVEAVMDTMQALHPYDVPEILCLPIPHGLPAYLDWIVTETRPVTAPDRPK